MQCRACIALGYVAKGFLLCHKDFASCCLHLSAKAASCLFEPLPVPEPSSAIGLTQMTSEILCQGTPSQSEAGCVCEDHRDVKIGLVLACRRVRKPSWKRAKHHPVSHRGWPFAFEKQASRA